MSGRTRRVPKYQRHRPSGQAFAEFSGFRLYLGAFESPQSWTEYHRAVAEWLAGRPISKARTSPEREAVLVSELILAFCRWAEGRYVKDGRPTAEPRLFITALKPVNALYGSEAVDDFGPLALQACRERLIRGGHCRVKVNSYVGRIVRVFKWGVSREMVAESTWRALRSVEGLRAGESAAPERDKVEPVSQNDVDRTIPHLSPVLRAMVKLQLATGMRPGEVCQLRAADVDQSGDVWKYRPGSHKTEHHGRTRTVYLGPQARAILSPWLETADPDRPLFSPAESKRWYVAQRAAARKTPRPPSQVQRKPKARPAKSPGRQWDVAAYGKAIARACRKAGIAPWAPNRLRHAAATRIRAAGGIEAARVILGHASAVTSEVYAEADETRAESIIREVG